MGESTITLAPHTVMVVRSASFDTPSAAAARLELPVLDMAALQPSDIAQSAAVLFDVDLGDMPTVMRIREALAKLKTPPPILFAVDRGKNFHRQTTQANALRARAILSRPYGAADIYAALDNLKVPFQRPAPQPEAPDELGSVKAASRLLGASFAALSSGEPLDLAQAEAASRELFADVGKAGLHGWLDNVRAHHDGTFQHCLLVTGAAVAYARHTRLPDVARNNLIIAALLHDIGKAQIPNAILDKPGKLTDEEFAIIRKHPQLGADYITRQEHLPLVIIDAVLHHHEYLDGSGYPHGLRADQISPFARILTVCDVYGALIEQRSYKPAKSQAEALYVLISMAQRGKIEYGIVRTLAAALGAKLPETMVAVGAA